MIQFNDWVISDDCSTQIIAMQYDNLSCSLTVVGDLPDGWDWAMLVECSGNLNIIALSPVEGGVGVTLTADMIPYAGYYRMQLRGTQGEAVRHTNIIQVYIPESLTGEGQWPDLPSEFGQIEERMQELAGQAQDSADAADTSAKAAAESAAAAQGAEESVAANAKAAQDAANAAQTSEGNAKTSETNAAKSAGDAQTSAGQAADSATQAKTAQGKAEAAQTAAETAQGKAETAAGTATQAVQGAVTSAGQASQSAQEAASAATAAQNAQKAAENAQGQAEAQATAAAWSATAAQESAVAAAWSATAAQESAVAAAGSSSSASGSAQTAQTAAQNAQKSAETAQEARQGAQAAQQAIEDLEVSSETLEPDSPASVEKTVSPEGVVTLEFGIPRGPQGQPGASAPQINDAIITDANPWSAKKIVDTLAPEFETSGAVVTCTPVAGYPLHVVSQIMPVQGGEGDPSPDNVRPISGWDSATLTHNDTPITIQLGQTVYGGTLDWTTGVLTVGSIFLKLDTTYSIGLYQFQDKNGVLFSAPLLYESSRIEGICSHEICTNQASIPNKSYIWLGVDNQIVYWIGVLDVLGLSTVDEFKSWLDTQDVQIVYPAQEPVTIQLTPQEILALSGINTIYTDTGDTTVSGRADPNATINNLAQRIAALEGQAING